MKRPLVAAVVLVVVCVVPASARIFSDATTTYDIESNHVVGVVSFVYERSAFDGQGYQFNVTAVLHPYDWLPAMTYQDSWSASIDRAASENDYVFTMISVQQYDPGTGHLIDSDSKQSAGISIPIRSLLIVYEDWDGQLHLDSAKWVVFGDAYTYTAYDYPDLVFIGWSGNIQSTSRSISGTINETSFTLIASYTTPPPPPPPDGTQTSMMVAIVRHTRTVIRQSCST